MQNRKTQPLKQPGRHSFKGLRFMRVVLLILLFPMISSTNVEDDECSSDPCQNGGTCTDRQNSFICTCVNGYEGTTCGTTVWLACGLVIGSKPKFMMIPLDTIKSIPTFGSATEILTYDSPGYIGEMDVDTIHGYLYWGHPSPKSLCRARLDGTDRSTIVSGDGLLGLALDSQVSQLYFTRMKQVEKVNVDGTGRTSLLTVVCNRWLSGIVLDLVQRLMFFTSAKEIFKAGMDGSGTTMIANVTVMYLGGIAIYHHNKQICWLNKPGHRVECSDYDGHHRKEIFTTTANPCGLYIDKGMFYWADEVNLSVTATDANGTATRIIDVSQYATAISSLTLSKYNCTNIDKCASNPCHHGDCNDHVDRFSCSCVIGYNGTICETELYSPELDPPNTKEASMSLIDANNDTCLILGNIEMYTFSQSTNQWLPPPQNACWRSGLVIKHLLPGTIQSSFTVRITGQRLVCAMTHLKVMTRNTKLSGCGLVSGDYSICKLSGITEPNGGSRTTCVAACQYSKKKPKYVIIEIANNHEGWKLCELISE